MIQILKKNKQFASFSLLAALLLISALPCPSAAQSLDDRVNEISSLLMCPVCQGQSVSESNSNLANDMRQIIRKQLQEGKSKEEILAYFVSSYGESILASPPAKGVNWVLWILPGLAIIFGGLGIGLFLYKTRTGKEENTNIRDDQSTLGENDYMKRIDEELKRHDS